jgi:hypothetical protein
MARGLNLHAIRAPIDRLTTDARRRVDEPWTLAELLTGCRLEEPVRSMTLEDLLTGSWLDGGRSQPCAGCASMPAHDSCEPCNSGRRLDRPRTELIKRQLADQVAGAVDENRWLCRELIAGAVRAERAAVLRELIPDCSCSRIDCRTSRTGC